MKDERISVIVPMLNEAADIAGCIERIGAQALSGPTIELILVDSASEDDTIAIAEMTARRVGLDNVIVLGNPARRTSIGLNVGLDAATGSYVVRIDARSRIEPDYVARCVTTLQQRSDVGVVGGAQLSMPRSHAWEARSIARALNNRWLTGFARYRRGGVSGPTDTVWMGVFRTEDLRDLGGWDDETALNEDYELNERYRASGRLVWFDHTVRSGYLPRASMRLVARQYLSFGRVKADGWAHGRRPALRQLALLSAPPVVAALGIGAGVVVGWLPVVAGGLAVAAIADARGVGEPAPAAERAGALVVNAVTCASWWWGVVSGFVASRRGRRPQHALAARPTR